MRNLALLLAATAAASCGGGGDEKGTPKACANAPVLGGACTNVVLENCDCQLPTRVLGCNGTAWTQIGACGTGMKCGETPTGSGQYGCVPDTSQPVAEFGECVGTGQGNCVAGLTCVASTGAPSICFTACNEAQPTSCGANRECEATGGTPSGVCFTKTALRDDECGLNFNVCVDAAQTCELTTYDDSTGNIVPTSLNCKATCTANNVNTTTGCTGGEICLDMTPTLGLIDPQPSPNTCPAVGNDTGCTTAQGYKCMQTGAGLNCARDITWCGTPVGMIAAFTANDIIAADACNYVDGHDLCGVTGATGTPADVACYDFGPDQNNNPVPRCVGFCEPPTGSTTNLDCGTNYVCYADPDGFYSFQSPNPGTCPAAACDTGNGYSCVNFGGTTGMRCARPLKTCEACKSAASGACVSDAQCCTGLLCAGGATAGVCD